MTMRPGVLRRLTDGEAWSLLRDSAITPAEDDTVLGYAYADMDRAEQYAASNRARGYTVAGPVPARAGEAWATLVIPPKPRS